MPVSNFSTSILTSPSGLPRRSLTAHGPDPLLNGLYQDRMSSATPPALSPFSSVCSILAVTKNTLRNPGSYPLPGAVSPGQAGAAGNEVHYGGVEGRCFADCPSLTPSL